MTPYNVKLHEIGKSQNEECHKCNTECESLLHLFWHSPQSITLWKHIEYMFSHLYIPNTNTVWTGPCIYLDTVQPHAIEITCIEFYICNMYYSYILYSYQ